MTYIKKKVKRYTVVFDFDGVIHSYKSGWKGIAEIPDPPVSGIKEAIDKIRETTSNTARNSHYHKL